MNSDSNEFLNKLSELKDFAALQGGYLTEEQIDEAFPDFNDQQRKMMVEYLEKNHIGINEPVQTQDYLNEEDQGYLRFYLEELDELEDVSDDMKRILIMNTMNGDLVAKKKLTESMLKNVVDIAKLYAGQGALVSDLIGEGNVALASAIDMINCVETPEDASAMIVKMIMNAMEELISVEGDESRKEEKALDTVIKVSTKAKEMSEELLRKVTVDELAEETRISRQRILEAIRISKACLDYIENPNED